MAKAATGDWDLSYGVNGRLALALPGLDFDVENWQPQADGRIVVSGRGSDYVIARFNADGTPDVSFDGDGAVRVTRGSVVNSAIEHTLLPDGRILFIAQTSSTTLSLRRLNVDGSMDGTFGTGGELTFSWPNVPSLPVLRLAADGSALVAGRLAGTSPLRIVVARVTPAGVLDATFGDNGYATLGSPEGHVAAYSMAVQSNGAVVLGGTANTLGDGPPLIARLTANGQVDSSFGSNGLVIPPFLQGTGRINDVAVTAEGKIYAAGERLDSHGVPRSFVARLNIDGTLDTTFGSAGRIVTSAQGFISSAPGIASIALQADGKLLAAGSTHEFRKGIGWLARYNTDGSPDPAFGLAGRTHVDLSSGVLPLSNLVYQVRQDADGGFRALVLTGSNYSPEQNYTLIRFVADGASPGVFGVRAIGDVATSESSDVPERDMAHPVMVYRAGGAGGAASVQYRTVAQTATAGQDFTALAGTLTFGPGEVVKQVELPILDDRLPEPFETFSFEIFGATGGASLARDRVGYTIIPSGDTGSSVRLLMESLSTAESAGVARLLVERSGDLTAPLTINYTTTASTATAGGDFNSSAGSVSWAANEGGVRNIDIALVNDATTEPDEVFSVAVSSADPMGQISPSAASATVRIIDDDNVAAAPTIGFKTTSVAVPENGATATIEVRRFGDVSQAISASWDNTFYSGNATAGADYTSASGTLTWAAGESTPKTISIPINNDAELESSESFSIRIVPNAPATLRYNASAASVFIADNETTADLPVINLGAATSVDEDAGLVSIPVTLSRAPATNVSVHGFTSYETAIGADLTPVSTTLSWAAGDASPRQLVVQIRNDALDEINETFSVNLINPVGGATLGAATSRLTILDDDPTPAGQSAPTGPRLVVTPAVASVSESAHTVRLEFGLSTAMDGRLYGEYSVLPGGTAGSPGDYINPDGYFDFLADGTDAQFLEIQINGDLIPEQGETFTVRFTPFSSPAVPIASVDATITILDDDSGGGAPAIVELVSATQSVNESATSVTLQVARSGNASIASSVDFTTLAGTASTADFGASSGTLTWQANDTSMKLITITLAPDSSDEPDESFTVQLQNASGGTQLGTATATVTIVDDDGAPSAGANAGGGGGGGGGGQESLIALLLWAGLVSLRLSARAQNKPLSR